MDHSAVVSGGAGGCLWTCIENQWTVKYVLHSHLNAWFWLLSVIVPSITNNEEKCRTMPSCLVF